VLREGTGFPGKVLSLSIEPEVPWFAGKELVQRTIQEMIVGGCEEVALEAEVANTGALTLYQSLGFIRDKRLHRYAIT
jgi:ribosomal protein S18 acetylase RimI-like enzyme